MRPPGGEPLSLRARLLLLVTAASLLAWGVAAAWSWRDARDHLVELLDAQLVQAARVILAQAEHELDEIDADDDSGPVLAPELERRYHQDLHLQIWNAEGRLVYQSSSELPRTPLVPLGSRGFFDRRLHGARWRVLALGDVDSELEIQICQRHDLRRHLAATVARDLVAPLAATLPLLALLAWAATGAGLRPLARLAAELQARQPEDLTPLPEARRPRELAPLARALDGLLARLRERLELERRLTADAAHELRTPLAALKTQAQVALTARDPDAREHALAQIVRGTDRMAHLVSQLLTLARLEHQGASRPATVDLAAVVREVAAEVAPEVARSGVRLELETPAPAPVDGDRTLLATLVRNLVDNALRHGGGGGEVRIRVTVADGTVHLRVADAGPGIPEAERERVFARFHRVAGSAGGGSGLGLSIVERVAALHGGSVGLGPAAGGRGVEVWARLPAAGSSPPAEG